MRNWRYHKEIRLWLTKDPSHPHIVAKNSTFERGTYIFFDVGNWERVRRECVIWYENFDPKIRYSQIEEKVATFEKPNNPPKGSFNPVS